MILILTWFSVNPAFNNPTVDVILNWIFSQCVQSSNDIPVLFARPTVDHYDFITSASSCIERSRRGNVHENRQFPKEPLLVPAKFLTPMWLP